MIFRLLLGNLWNVITMVVLLKYLGHLIYLLLHAWGFQMESFLAICAFPHFLPFFTFGSWGIIEGFGVPFLLWIFMCLSFIFGFRSMFWVMTAKMHSKNMCLGALDFSHTDELVLFLSQRFNKSIKSEHGLVLTRGQPHWMKHGDKKKVFWSNIRGNG